MEPAAVVVRRPSPRIGADPGPSIPVLPNPAALSVGRPIRARVRRAPDSAVRRYIHPAPVVIQILGAVNIAAHVLRAARLREIAVAVFVPTVELILSKGGDFLKFRIGSSAPHHHGF